MQLAKKIRCQRLCADFREKTGNGQCNSDSERDELHGVNRAAKWPSLKPQITAIAAGGGPPPPRLGRVPGGSLNFHHPPPTPPPTPVPTAARVRVAKLSRR